MLKFFKSLYLHKRFFYTVFGVALLFLWSFWWHALYPFTWLIVFVFFLIFLGEITALYRENKFWASRHLPDKFSNGDDNPVDLYFQNNYLFTVRLDIIDELPLQFQKRDFLRHITIEAEDRAQFRYALHPVERGAYRFGHLNCYISTGLRLIRRRYKFQDEQLVEVYPSFIQMKEYDFLAIDNRISGRGLKKIRRIGHTMEFEQIKTYVRGDDIRTINWKATAKRGSLMVNQYQDERSQPIYSIIDTSRVMKMPFEGMTLLDYAINSTLAFSNIALKKNDKIGMLTYADKIENFLPASSQKTVLNRLMEILYNIDTAFSDSDLGMLYAHLKRKLNQRSLIMLYTNFEHISSLNRQLPFLKAIGKQHLLVVVFFENTALKGLLHRDVENIPEIYDQTIARQFKNDKKRILKKLQQNGIQALLTTPQELTVDTINQYLELKSRGML